MHFHLSSELLEKIYEFLLPLHRNVLQPILIETYNRSGCAFYLYFLQKLLFFTVMLPLRTYLPSASKTSFTKDNTDLPYGLSSLKQLSVFLLSKLSLNSLSALSYSRKVLQGMCGAHVPYGDHSIPLAGPCICACCGIFYGETEH